MKITRLGPATILAFTFAVPIGARNSANRGPLIPAQSSSPLSDIDDSAGIATGTGIVGTLSTKLDTKHSKVGDPVEVEVTQDVLEGHRIVLKKGSHVTGHVTDVSAYSRKVFNARLEIVLDSIFPVNGEQISVYLAVFALAARHDAASDNLQDSRAVAASAQSPKSADGSAGPPGGVLKPDSKGVFNLFDLSLTPMARDNPPTSLVHSQSQDILLDKGTEVVLIVEGNNNLSAR